MQFTRGSFLGAPINPVPSSAVGIWNNNDVWTAVTAASAIAAWMASTSARKPT